MPKVLGTYEMELRPVVDRALRLLRPDIVVDVGAAEGNYAAGLAWPRDEREGLHSRNRAARARVDPGSGQERQSGTQAASGWGMHPASLRAVLRGGRGARTVVIVDLEAYERELLDPIAVPGPRRAHVRVGVREFVGRPIGHTNSERIRGSHRIEEIREAPRTIANLPLQLSVMDRTLFRSSWMGVMSEKWPERMRRFFMSPGR
jgi:hypothetical protein